MKPNPIANKNVKSTRISGIHSQFQRRRTSNPIWGIYQQVTSDFEFKFIPTNQTREYTAGVLLRGDQLRPRMLNIKTVRDEN